MPDEPPSDDANDGPAHDDGSDDPARGGASDGPTRDDPSGEPNRDDTPTNADPVRGGPGDAAGDAPPGRRVPDYRGEAVEGVPVLRRVPTDTGALVRVETSDATAWCPYEGTADYYELRLAYWPDGHALELMSYRDYLQTFRDEDVGHEAFGKRVYDDLVALLDPAWLRLTVAAPPRYGLETTLRHQTAPMPAGLRETAPVEASYGAGDAENDGGA